MTTQLNRAVFAGREGETFRIRTTAPEAIETTLAEVTASPPEKERPFSILFHGPIDPVLPQGTYEFEHESLGTFTLFIVPVGPDPSRQRMQYEAVFN
jgi:hypothetical protein